MDDCDTFREELAIKYPKSGHALWEPDPGALYDAVEVGDVGYIREGKFHRLFNVFLPGDHPSHRNYGVPEYHELLQLNMEEHIDKGIDNRKNFCSKHVVQVSHGHQYNASGPDDDAQVTFSCCGKRGALLFLPFPAQREDTVARGEFGRWIVKHINVWFTFAKNLGLGINGIEDIILVTGRHRARSWIYATFHESQPGSQVSFGVHASGDSSVHLQWRDARGGELKLGPSGENLRENQCIFVRGYRVIRVMNLWPRLRGLAGPTPDAEGDETGPDKGLELISVPAGPKYQDPLHKLLEYMVEKSPHCDMALVHDDDFACLDGGSPDTLAGVSRHLRDFSPEIQQLQWDVLPDNEIGTGTEAETVRVAMLSQDAYKAKTRPGGQSLSISAPSREGCRSESSLPNDVYIPDSPSTDSLLEHVSLGHPEVSGYDSDTIAPSNASDPDLDSGNESGMVDTDIELEYIAPDDASQNTFALDQGVDYYIADPKKSRHGAGFLVVSPVDSHDDDSNVSKIGSRGLAIVRSNRTTVRAETASDHSLRAQETDLGWKETYNREKDHAATIRLPTNDDDSVVGMHVSATNTDREKQSSGSLSTPNWSTFNNNAGVSTVDNDVYQGLDLDYIMNIGTSADPGSRRLSHPFIAPSWLPPHRSKEKSQDVNERRKERSKGKDLLVDPAMEDIISLSGALSNIPNVAPWPVTGDTTGTRRYRTETIDNSFGKAFQLLDPFYPKRCKEWSFIREREQVVLAFRDPDVGPRTWDVWRCAQIGKIRLRRVTISSSNPNKPEQQRLKAEHDVDPDCENKLGGPTTIIHRHSRALAFSIFRHYSPRDYANLTASSPNVLRSSEGRIISHDLILLAVKHVQQRFTYTESTSRLNTHGLLAENGDNRRDKRHGPRATHPNPPSQELHDQPMDPRGSQVAHIASLPGPTAFASSASPSQAALSVPSLATVSTSSVSERQLPPHDEAEEDSDSFAIDQIKDEQVPAPTQTKRRSISNWIPRRIGAPGSTMPRTDTSSLMTIIPPWMTLSPRSVLQKQEGVVQALRPSSKEVGLMPSSRPTSDAAIEGKGKGKSNDVLSQVPDDSLFMLVPLWPAETDPATAARERPIRGLDHDQNLYLLVYYVPFDKRGEGNPTKKPPRFRSRKGDRKPHHHHPMPLFDVRRGFKVVARLITHSDLNGSGIRRPIRGLSVTGPLAQAELGIPPASLRAIHSDVYVIGACLDSDGAIELLPEGLEKLGLCAPHTEPLVQRDGTGTTNPMTQTAEPVEEVGPRPLTAIGRAAVEVVWLGCMALTTFCGAKSQDRE